MQLSRLENLAYERLKESNLFLFKIKDLRLLLGIKKMKAYNIVKSLKKKGAIKKAGKNFLALRDADEFVISSTINYPSYISFWSALNYYGFSDNMSKKIFLATTKYSREINNFKYVSLSKNRFFGYTKIGNAVFAEKEKAIVDSMLFPKYSGGIREITKSLGAALNQMDMEKLFEYAIKVNSKAALRRLGYLLEHLNFKGNLAEKLRKKIGRGYELLEPSLKRKNNLNKRWLLDVNC